MAYVIDLSDDQIFYLRHLISQDMKNMKSSLSDFDPELYPGMHSYLDYRIMSCSDILSAIDESYKYVQDLPFPD